MGEGSAPIAVIETEGKKSGNARSTIWAFSVMAKNEDFTSRVLMAKTLGLPGQESLSLKTYNEDFAYVYQGGKTL